MHVFGGVHGPGSMHRQHQPHICTHTLTHKQSHFEIVCIHEILCDAGACRVSRTSNILCVFALVANNVHANHTIHTLHTVNIRPVGAIRAGAHFLLSYKHPKDRRHRRMKDITKANRIYYIEQKREREGANFKAIACAFHILHYK